MKHFLKYLLSFSILICLTCLFVNWKHGENPFASTKKDENQKPLNIILITADDLGLQLGCYGDKIAKTPNIDMLAAKGMRFENAYVTQSSCSPSRSSLLTGLYPHQNGQIGLANRGYSMHDGIVTMPALLKNAGYRTGIIGKLHVNPENAFPFDYERKNTDQTRDVRSVAEMSNDFIREDFQKPFFLYINYFDPHHQFIKQVKNIPESPYTRSTVRPFDFQGINSPRQLDSIAGYYNGVTRVDAGIGFLLEKLNQLQLLENTVLIFVGDNGPPFARAKTSCYEAGLRVPLLLYWPGVTQKKSISKSLISVVDIMPTILEVANLDVPKNLPGQSLTSLLTNKNSKWRQTLYTEFTAHTHLNYFPRRSIRNKRYKLIVNLLTDRSNPAIGVDGDIAYQASRDPVYLNTIVSKAFDVFKNPPAEELYDLQNDPNEFMNLSDNPSYTAIKNKLKAELMEWRVSTQDPLLDKEKFAALTLEHDKKFKNEKNNSRGDSN